ncbi:vWA domain-containing protein [Actinoplanes couchii]|nr:VWA-like domain-containing protein [Actinoplanes couchii]
MEPGVRFLGLDELPVEARQKWAASRVWAARQAPYLATALLALVAVVVDQSEVHGPAPYDLRRFPVDRGWRVYLDQAELTELPVPVIGYWLVHQVTHLIRDHAVRYPGTAAAGGAPLGNRDPDSVRWNVATDCEINDDLNAGAVELPEDAPLPGHFDLPDGWLAEQYWHALEGSVLPDVDCGSGTDGEARDWDSDKPGVDGPSGELIKREVARRVLESMEAGGMPGGWQRWAEQLTSPRENWRRHLSSTIRRGVADVAGRIDFTYQRPSRRNGVSPGVILPSMRQPAPRVAILIDTSGSMRDAQLGQALAEVNGVVRSIGVARRDLRVICCDEKAYNAQKVFDARAIQLEGEGGTDLREGLAAVAELRPTPHLVVVLTDGHTPWPEQAPRGQQVVVGLLDREGTVPPWAKRILIDTRAEAGETE